MRSIVNHVIDGIITIDETGTVTTFNPAAERIFGYAGEEVIGQNVKMLMPEPYHGEHDGYLTNYKTTGQQEDHRHRPRGDGRRKNGTTFPMDLAVSEFRLGGTRLLHRHRPRHHRAQAGGSRAAPGRRAHALGAEPRPSTPSSPSTSAGTVDYVQPGGRKALRLRRRRGGRPERQDADAGAVPRRARRLHRQLRRRRPGEDHRHRPRGGRAAQGRHDLPDGPGGQRVAARQPTATSPASSATSPSASARRPSCDRPRSACARWSTT